jgi:hypothetical protein
VFVPFALQSGRLSEESSSNHTLRQYLSKRAKFRSESNLKICSLLRAFANFSGIFTAGFSALWGHILSSPLLERDPVHTGCVHSHIKKK